MMSFFRSILILLASSSAAVSSAAVDSALDAQVQEMIAWVRNHEGFFNPKLRIRHVDPTDLTSYVGVFATEYIKPLEDLMTIPSSVMIWAVQPENVDIAARVLCDLTHVLMKELRLGAKSEFAPFVKYLLAQERGEIPATWTQAGQELLSEIARDEIEMTTWMTNNFDTCIDLGDAFEQQALALVISRGWDSVLVPIYDMLNHNNDLSKRNTDNSPVHGEEGITVWASRAIQAGEEIFLTYDDCNDCYFTPDEWGTPELLRDFGFVETYPQIYFFREAGALFQVDKVKNNEDAETQHLQVEWQVYEHPSQEGFDWIKQEHQRLQDIQHAGTLAKRRHLMPKKEWNIINEYHQALMAALEAAIDADHEDEHEDENEDYDEEDL
jgi:hypothetical protein